MFYTREKLRDRIEELAELRYRDTFSVSEWAFQLDATGEIGARPPELANMTDTMKLGDVWSGPDTYAWLGANVAVPKEWEGRRVLGRFDFGRTGGGTNSGFESLLYVDGEPYQGVDSNHTEVFLQPADIGRNVHLQFRLWSGIRGPGTSPGQPHRLNMAQLAWLDEATDDLYFTGRAILQTIQVLPEESPDAVDLLKLLDQAVLRLDFSAPGSEEFYESVGSARSLLTESLTAMEKRNPVVIRCIGHTHIDVAWLWRLKHTREKSARSFSTVLRLMEMFPEYVFLQSQPQLYDYIRTDYPDIYKAIKERVREGRWEPNGAMWLEADCNLVSGESLVRQILFGTRFFEKEFNRSCTYLWLPDVFGYSWALPQILKKSGIESFMTTKISWNQYNRMPHDTFYWRGLDGSEVLAHFITTPEPVPHGWFYTYNGQITATTVAGAWEAYRDKSVNKELLLSYGFGDGGGGVTREMLEMRRRLDMIPGMPQVVTGRADEYFERLRETVRETTEYVHTWDGELYLEYHRGTYTSQAHNKRMNRKLELGYRQAEWLNVFSSFDKGISAARGAQNTLNGGWKIILRNQFHDIIPGSSIHEVYEDSRLEYQEAEGILRGVEEESSLALRDDAVENAFTIFNSAGWTRTAIVKLQGADIFKGGHFIGADDRVLPSQIVEDEVWVLCEATPALGSSSIAFVPDGSDDLAPPSFTVEADGVKTPYYDIRWNEYGQLSRLFDLTANRDVLQPDTLGNVLQVFEDKPMAHDAWDIDIYYQEKMREVRDLAATEIVSVGAIATTIRFVWKYQRSTVTQRMTVYANSPRIDFATEIDWHERQQLLKVAFPVDVRATSATYDIQFGNTERPTHWNTSWDQARFETVGHQWVDVSEHGYGVALANDCKYGYDVKDGVLRLSLLKSAIYPDPEADQGHHEFTYSLIPHQGSWLEGNVVQEAWDLNSPLFAKGGRSLNEGKSLFHVSGSAVMVDAIKLAEDEDKIVLRVHDYSGGRQMVHVSSDFDIRSWQACNLLERAEGEVRRDLFQFALNAYEIKTFLVEMSEILE